MSSAGKDEARRERSPDGTLFWLAGLLVLPFTLGIGLGHGPELLRRPILTPLVIGAIIGICSARWGAATNHRPGRRGLVLVMLSAAMAVGLMHVEVFRQVREVVRANNQTQSPMLWAEQLLEEAGMTEEARREWRLARSPTVTDYLTHRSALLLGETLAPVPWLVIVGEMLLSGGVAFWICRRMLRWSQDVAADSASRTLGVSGTTSSGNAVTERPVRTEQD